MFGVTEFENIDVSIRKLSKLEPVYITYNAELYNIKTLSQLIDYHILTIKRNQPNGPYILLGFSAAGIIANLIFQKLNSTDKNIFFSIDCLGLDIQKKVTNTFISGIVKRKFFNNYTFTYKTIINLKFIHIGLTKKVPKYNKLQPDYLYFKVPSYNIHWVKNMPQHALSFIFNIVNDNI